MIKKLIADLSDPAAYPYSVDEVEVRQTHISAVFLAGDYVYKVKKPVDYGFLNFGTLDKRRHYCEEEVRLNRRLAPHVYLGVVSITRRDEGLCFEGEGEPIEWAVKMRRLPDAATLQNRLQNDDVYVAVMRSLGRRIAEFHANADSGPSIAEYGRFDVVAGNARENFDQSVDQIGQTVSEPVFRRLASLTEDALTGHRELISSRAERGIPRDTHGDLRLDHVYIFSDREPPDDLVFIDCIEFTERFRFADPISDVAFLVMGLHLQDRRDLGRAFLDAYLQASGDEEGRALVPFYTAYRATIRGKVEGLKLSRDEMTDADRTAAKAKSRGSWLLALDELESPHKRPCLLLVTGLPGTGKSTLARTLAEQADMQLIRSDVVRKKLAGIETEVVSDRSRGSDSRSQSRQEFRTPSDERDPSGEFGFGDGIYTAEWNRRTYEECLHQAQHLLFLGKRVIVDANFRSEADRRLFLDAATQLGVRSGVLMCEADAEIVRERLENRQGDASDADWSVYVRAAESWEEPSLETQSVVRVINTGGSREDVMSQAKEALRQLELSGPGPFTRTATDRPLTV